MCRDLFLKHLFLQLIPPSHLCSVVYRGGEVMRFFQCRPLDLSMRMCCLCQITADSLALLLPSFGTFAFLYKTFTDSNELLWEHKHIQYLLTYSLYTTTLYSQNSIHGRRNQGFLPAHTLESGRTHGQSHLRPNQFIC